jgi:hypothetical protein
MVPIGQTRPHIPQLLGDVWRLTQVEPQHDCPLGQVQLHMPIVHERGAMQALLHIPQWALSLWRLTQRPAQRVCPVGHVQRPVMQL